MRRCPAASSGMFEIGPSITISGASAGSFRELRRHVLFTGSHWTHRQFECNLQKLGVLAIFGLKSEQPES